MLDRDGYRPNVGIILCNGRNEVFWGKRVKEHSWQFPQGGIKLGETPVQAMYRELREEVGLLPSHVKILGRTRNWLRYEVPARWLKRDWRGNYRMRCTPACLGAARVRCLAVERLLGSARIGDRFQAGRLSARAHRARTLPFPRSGSQTAPGGNRVALTAVPAAPLALDTGLAWTYTQSIR